MSWTEEVAKKSRFQFGSNWKNFSKLIDNNRVAIASECLTDFVGKKDFTGLTFLDVGCGSGLMSLAAYQLGAKVVSFDYDRNSVECTRALLDKFCTDFSRWTVMEGSVLDQRFMKSLGNFDVIYSWGVLHHTGMMWQAMDNLEYVTKPGSIIYIAIYNYQEHWSEFYTWLKRTYNRSNIAGRVLLLSLFLLYTMGVAAAFDLARLKNPFKRYRDKNKQRGMSYFYDAVDWVGGYPFEVAKPEEVFLYFSRKGYELVNLKTVGGGLACNEYCFRKSLFAE